MEGCNLRARQLIELEFCAPSSFPSPQRGKYVWKVSNLPRAQHKDGSKLAHYFCQGKNNHSLRRRGSSRLTWCSALEKQLLAIIGQG